MRDLDDQIKESLERLVDSREGRPTDTLWNDLVARRRRRRVRNGALAALPILLVAVLAVGLLMSNRSDDPRTDVATGGDGPSVEPSEPGTTGNLRVERIEVVGNGPLVGGTERVVIEFNEPLPSGEVEYVSDITSLDHARGLVFTTQGPTTTHVCDSAHAVPEGAVGSVDLLIPARWFTDDHAHEGPPLETVDAPAKVVICGPYNGFFQYSIWSPLSADPSDVTAIISPDRTRLTVETASESGTALDPRAGQAAVAEFLDDLRAGDVESAAELWSGYPEAGPDDPVSERVRHIDDLLADPTFARILVSDTTTTFVSPSTDEAGQVVTVLDARTGETPPAAITFLTGWSAEQGNPGDMWIHRLPLQEPSTDVVDLPAGSYAAPEQEIVVPGVPIEGGARAFVNEQEIPVDVDHENLTMTITIPPDAEGDIAVTIVASSPELPSVHAFAVTVRP